MSRVVYWLRSSGPDMRLSASGPICVGSSWWRLGSRMQLCNAWSPEMCNLEGVMCVEYVTRSHWTGFAWMGFRCARSEARSAGGAIRVALILRDVFLMQRAYATQPRLLANMSVTRSALSRRNAHAARRTL